MLDALRKQLIVLYCILLLYIFQRLCRGGLASFFCVIFYKKGGVKGDNWTFEIKISFERPLADSQQQY